MARALESPASGGHPWSSRSTASATGSHATHDRHPGATRASAVAGRTAGLAGVEPTRWQLRARIGRRDRDQRLPARGLRGRPGPPRTPGPSRRPRASSAARARAARRRRAGALPHRRAKRCRALGRLPPPTAAGRRRTPPGLARAAPRRERRGRRRGRPLRGAVLRRVVTVQDISAWEAAEQALREREALLRNAHQVAGLGSWRFDLGGETFACSPEVAALYGLEALDGARYEDFRSTFHPTTSRASMPPGRTRCRAAATTSSTACCARARCAGCRRWWRQGTSWAASRGR